MGQEAEKFRPKDESNKYEGPIGGDWYEPDEENPLMGFRGWADISTPSSRT